MLALPISLALLMIGLIASMFHLGHPERAWRAVLMWRTSWLSREVIILPIFIGITCLALLYAYLGQNSTWIWIALIAASFALWVCTAKIYQCIRFIQEWAHFSTIVNFIILGLASGWMLLSTLLLIWFGSETISALVISQIGFILIAVAMLIKLWIWKRNRNLRPMSTINSATGLKASNVRQTSMGMTGGSFNTKEFFHHQSDLVIRNLRRITLIAAYILPLIALVLAIGQNQVGWIFVAFAIHVGGLIAERFLFFADANHPQNLYYQRIS
jgi:DMSO reductase anchor subunit